MNSYYWKLLVSVNLAISCLAVVIYLSRDISTANFPFIQGTEMSKVQVSVSIDDAHFPQIEQISQQLQLSGMDVKQTLSSIGIINGSIESDRLNNLSQIEGVQNVEAQQGYQLAPPSSPIQ